MKKITFVTGNWSKILSAKQILEPLGIEVNHVKIKTTEIQADSVEDIAMHSAKEASDKLKCNVLKNDTGLFVEALGGFPGPYTHYVDERIGEDGLLKLLEGIENRNACFIEAFAYCEYGKSPIVFKSLQKVQLQKKNQEPSAGVGILSLFQKDMIKQWETIMMMKDVMFGILMVIKNLQNS